MRTYDFSPLWRSTVGFDRMFDLINNEVPHLQDSYPPYDIERTGEESYRISMALAGFTPDQVRNIRNAFRVLYRSELLLADAVAQLTEAGKTQPEVAALVEFIGRSERSLVR